MTTPMPKSRSTAMDLLRAIRRGTRSTGKHPNTQTVDSPR